MRNLKKFLALVLAMMMAFSLMVTANATTTGTQYGDADGVTEAFEEAVDVLTGMGVYSGDNGNFKPAANITRAEVAALIYRLATGDVTDAQANLYAEYGNFPDVPHDAWYAGYVGYCANAGYIKGRPNGNFDPSGNVTGYEALAMILRAIGYDKNGEFTGSTWTTEVSALSQQLGILTNVKTTQYGGTLYLAARRDVVADLLFQADAYVPMVVYTPAFGYQPYGMVNGGSGSLIGTTQTPNPTLGNRIFGLTYTGTANDKASACLSCWATSRPARARASPSWATPAPPPSTLTARPSASRFLTAPTPGGPRLTRALPTAPTRPPTPLRPPIPRTQFWATTSPTPWIPASTCSATS